MFDWILPFIAILGLLIFVHELGHFIAAKRSGVKVEKFSLGFPPNIFSKKIGDTEYCLGLIPLGGYVKMKGDIPDFADDKTEPTGEPGEYMSASNWKKALILIAGPAMNIITAYLLFVIMMWAWGNPTPRPNSTEIGGVGPNTPALSAGLLEGDRILDIDGITFQDFATMADYIKSRPEQEIAVKIDRQGEEKLFTIKTMKYEIPDSLGNTLIEGRIGIDPVFDFKASSPLTAIRDGFTATVFVSTITVEFLWKLVTRKESVDNLGGPIMIADQAGKAMRKTP